MWLSELQYNVLYEITPSLKHFQAVLRLCMTRSHRRPVRMTIQSGCPEANGRRGDVDRQQAVQRRPDRRRAVALLWLEKVGERGATGPNKTRPTSVVVQSSCRARSGLSDQELQSQPSPSRLIRVDLRSIIFEGRARCARCGTECLTAHKTQGTIFSS